MHNRCHASSEYIAQLHAPPPPHLTPHLVQSLVRLVLQQDHGVLRAPAQATSQTVASHVVHHGGGTTQHTLPAASDITPAGCVLLFADYSHPAGGASCQSSTADWKYQILNTLRCVQEAAQRVRSNSPQIHHGCPLPKVCCTVRCTCYSLVDEAAVDDVGKVTSLGGRLQELDAAQTDHTKHTQKAHNQSRGR